METMMSECSKTSIIQNLYYSLTRKSPLMSCQAELLCATIKIYDRKCFAQSILTQRGIPEMGLNSVDNVVKIACHQLWAAEWLGRKQVTLCETVDLLYHLELVRKRILEEISVTRYKNCNS